MALKDKLKAKGAEFYAKHIKDWQHSGLSQEKYCKSVNIAYSAFVYWRVKFLAKDKKFRSEKKFIPLEPLSTLALTQRSSSIAENQKITVVTSDGTQLSFPLSIEPIVLGNYIRAIRINP